MPAQLYPHVHAPLCAVPANTSLSASARAAPSLFSSRLVHCLTFSPPRLTAPLPADEEGEEGGGFFYNQDEALAGAAQAALAVNDVDEVRIEFCCTVVGALFSASARRLGRECTPSRHAGQAGVWECPAAR